jgi:hypothetical protein
MRKLYIFLFLFLFSLVGAKAQQGVTGPYTIGEIIFEGYLIRVVPINSNGFGYSIFFKNKMVVQQQNNPFTSSPLGLKNKEEAYKLAKWQVQQLHQRRSSALIKNQRFSGSVAKQLSISSN